MVVVVLTGLVTVVVVVVTALVVEVVAGAGVVDVVEELVVVAGTSSFTGVISVIGSGSGLLITDAT